MIRTKKNAYITVNVHNLITYTIVYHHGSNFYYQDIINQSILDAVLGINIIPDKMYVA